MDRAGARRDVLSLAVAALAVTLAAAARRRGLDVDLFLAVNGWRAMPDGVWHLLSVAGLGVTALLVLTLGPRFRPAVVAALLWLFVVGGGLVQLVKHLFPSPRPAGMLDAAVLHLIGDRLRLGSMPSGHAMTAAAVVCILWLAGGPFWRRRAVIAAAAIVAAAAALSRVATGAHWPTDVAAGAVLGWSAARCSVHLAHATRTDAFLRSPPGRWILGATQIGCGAAIAAVDLGYPATQPFLWALGMLGFGAGLRTLAERCAPAVAARASLGAGPPIRSTP
jgi:membrane-associated phospholipid phosphatase